MIPQGGGSIVLVASMSASVRSGVLACAVTHDKRTGRSSTFRR